VEGKEGVISLWIFKQNLNRSLHSFLIMELTVVLEKQKEGGFTVYVPSLPGCISEGDTREEALENIKEAIELYLEPDTNELIEHSGEQVKLSV
jgi:predicted RNase H-like HicB family nuclease